MENKTQQDLCLDIFSKVKDPRIETYQTKHLLIDIIMITVCAVICRFDTWNEIEEFGKIKENWFKKFLSLPNGIPSHDTFRRVFMLLEPKEFNTCFTKWTQSISEQVGGDIIALDGKAVRGSLDRLKNKKAVHIVSAWSTKKGIVLSQEKVKEKSNEIVAIPEVLKSIDITDSIVTIDAMGCQREIASQIIDQKGAYVLALKGNQLSLSQRVKAAFEKGLLTDFENMNYDFYQTIDEGHGRYEERNLYLLKRVDFSKSFKDWKGLKSVGLVESFVTRNGKSTKDYRYYLTSLDSSAKKFGECTRSHWQVENNLHWMLDIHFNDDGDYKREKNSASNFSILKRMALNLLKQDPLKGTIRSKRLRAVLNEDYLEQLVFSLKTFKPG